MDKLKLINAKIKETRLGYESHGIFTFFLVVELEGGCSIGIGNIALDEWNDNEKRRIGTAIGLDMIIGILEVVGVKNWEDLPGKYIRVNKVGLGESIKVIANVLDDRTIDIAKKLEKE